MTKLEVKRDTRDVDKRSSLMNMNETDSEDEAETSVPISHRPQCGTHSTAYKKKTRLTEWSNDPSLIDVEMDRTKSARETLRTELDRIMSEEDLWNYCFEVGRSALNRSIHSSKEYDARTREELKTVYELTLAECGPSMRKRRNLSLRDAVTELQERQFQLNEKIQEYTRMVQDATSSSKDPSKIPITTMAVDELNYDCDADYFQMSSKRSSQNEKMLQFMNQESNGSSGSNNSETKNGATGYDEDASKGQTDGESSPTKTVTSSSDSVDGNADALNGIDEDYKDDMCSTYEMPRGGCIERNGTDSNNNIKYPTLVSSEATTTEDKEESPKPVTEDRGVAKAVTSNEDGEDVNAMEVEERRSARVSAKDAAAAAAKTEMDGDEEGEDTIEASGREVMTILNSIDESVRIATNSMGDIEPFFYEEESTVVTTEEPTSPRAGQNSNTGMELANVDRGTDKAVLNAVLAQSNSLVMGAKKRKDNAEPLSDLSGESGWMQYIKGNVETGDGRRRRRGASHINVNTFVFPLTPRGVPLLVSPLSQYEDKYMGSQWGGVSGSNLMNGDMDEVTKDYYIRAHQYLPSFLKAEEDLALTRCSLQSASASSESKMRRLRQSLRDWKRQVDESLRALIHAEDVYAHTLQEDYIERKRIRKDLLQYGIAHDDLELPMSPVAENKWNPSNSSSNSNNNNHSKGGTKTNAGAKGGAKGSSKTSTGRSRRR